MTTRCTGGLHPFRFIAGCAARFLLEISSVIAAAHVISLLTRYEPAGSHIRAVEEGSPPIAPSVARPPPFNSLVVNQLLKRSRRAGSSSTAPTMDFSSLLIQLQVKLDEQRLVLEKYVDEGHKILQFNLAQDIKSIRFEVNLLKKEMTDCFHKGGNAVVYIVKQQKETKFQVDDLVVKQGYVLENQLRMNENLIDMHSITLTKLADQTTAIQTHMNTKMSVVEAQIKLDLATIDTTIKTSEFAISAQVKKFKDYYTTENYHITDQITFQKNDIRDHIHREVIKGERVLVQASS
ncbi:hypothetical protein KSP39_PZI010486 [Platanthera zijinensis]|uniref:Uncharacterized protein n=1 Tax=Platanthera zijinensis TaxID=2320716 RepID=A0AAP0BI64_9ASPA